MDWIKAHFECSLQHALLVLRERVKADIDQWQTQSGPEAKINVTMDGPRFVISMPEFQDLGPWVAFEAKENYILVRSGNSQTIDQSKITTSKLIPTVNTEGQCRFRKGSEELDFWQASRLILEDVLFS